MDNYVDLAIRTKSAHFHKELLPDIQQDILLEPMDTFFNEVVDVANIADAIKKALFYGKMDTVLPECNVTIDLSKIEPDLLHGILGIISETGELLLAIESGDVVNIEEESGDFLWYLAIIFKKLGIDFPQVMHKNIAKLQTRFPNRFTEHDALYRDLPAERAVLES